MFGVKAQIVWGSRGKGGEAPRQRVAVRRTAEYKLSRHRGRQQRQRRGTGKGQAAEAAQRHRQRQQRQHSTEARAQEAQAATATQTRRQRLDEETQRRRRETEAEARQYAARHNTRYPRRRWHRHKAQAAEAQGTCGPWCLWHLCLSPVPLSLIGPSSVQRFPETPVGRAGAPGADHGPPLL